MTGGVAQTESTINEFRIRVTVRNNLLLSAIEAAGYKTQADFARAADLRPTEVSELVALRRPPISPAGEFIRAARTIMEVLGACPSDLWTDAQLNMSLKRNTGETTMGADAVQEMLDRHITTMTLPDPADVLEEAQCASVVDVALSTLTDREQKVIRYRYGIGIEDKSERSLEEIGEQFGVGRERIRQIEQKALRKLRNPGRSEPLRDWLQPYWREDDALYRRQEKEREADGQRLQQEQRHPDKLLPNAGPAISRGDRRNNLEKKRFVEVVRLEVRMKDQPCSLLGHITLKKEKVRLGKIRFRYGELCEFVPPGRGPQFAYTALRYDETFIERLTRMPNFESLAQLVGD